MGSAGVNKVSELFGWVPCKENSIRIEEALYNQRCPYTNKICSKMRKSNPDIKLGTCSVSYQGVDVVICPDRFTEHNQIFLNCLHLMPLHEPGNELYLIPEVQVPGGQVDFFLVSAKSGQIKDFVGIEVQTIDTTGSVWPDRQKTLMELGLYAEKLPKANRPFGMNWKMTLKTILMQLHHKAETFEYLNKHLVLVIQEPLLGKMVKTFNFENISGNRIEDPIHIHSYSFDKSDNGFTLSLISELSTDAAGIERCLRLNPTKKIELDEILSVLESKIPGNSIGWNADQA